MQDVGFAIHDAVLAAHECDRLVASVEQESRRRGRAGARNLMARPFIAALANDERLLRIATRSLGSPAVPFRATLFEKSAAANWHVLWHQDRALPLAGHHESNDWGPWTHKAGVLYALAPAWALERVVALRLHIDDCVAHNGPLRVIPASHTTGVLSADVIRATVTQRHAKTCVVGRGGILAMRPLLLHSSMKARSANPRRVIHIEYADSLDLANGVRLCVA